MAARQFRVNLSGVPSAPIHEDIKVYEKSALCLSHLGFSSLLFHKYFRIGKEILTMERFYRSRVSTFLGVSKSGAERLIGF